MYLHAHESILNNEVFYFKNMEDNTVNRMTRDYSPSKLFVYSSVWLKYATSSPDLSPEDFGNGAFHTSSEYREWKNESEVLSNSVVYYNSPILVTETNVTTLLKRRYSLTDLPDTTHVVGDSHSRYLFDALVYYIYGQSAPVVVRKHSSMSVQSFQFHYVQFTDDLADRQQLFALELNTITILQKLFFIQGPGTCKWQGLVEWIKNSTVCRNSLVYLTTSSLRKNALASKVSFGFYLPLTRFVMVMMSSANETAVTG